MDYEHLREWTRPDSYMGVAWKGWAPVVGRSRDSDHLEESNFCAAVEILEAAPATLYLHGRGGDVKDIPAHVHAVTAECSHWLVGWVETLYVRLGSPAADAADKLLSDLDSYPVLDEGDFCAREFQAHMDSWREWGCADTWKHALRQLPEWAREWADANLEPDPEALWSLYSRTHAHDYSHAEGNGFWIDCERAGAELGWRVMAAARWSHDSPEVLSEPVPVTDLMLECLGQGRLALA